MHDLWYPVDCALCGQPIQDEGELVTTSAAWEDDAGLPCHEECPPGEIPADERLTFIENQDR